MKTIEDNDVTDRVGLVNAKTKTELSRPIWPSAICDENQTGPRRDQSYKCYLRWKWN